MAFSYFSEQNVDIAIIEVGLGGRLDSTNIITPELSVITNISLDHTNILGNTLREIAGEKAGIIKPGIPVVIGESHPETDQVFIQKAKETQSLILFADKQLQISKSVKEDEYLKVSISQNGNVLIENLLLDLTGTYQLKNILTVIQAVETLRALDFKIDNDALYAALKEVKGLTGLMGRWQILSKNPLIVCDTGHNIAGITEVMQNINDTPHNKLHVVIGMVKDKDISGVLNLLPAKATYYFCQPQLERALPAQELASEAENHGLKGFVFPTVELAINAAKKNANADDLIYIGGSTFVVAEIP
ncbi:bifunctional folylpolyglutamate synthase/dihydrofolate synthase [Pedobacter panaciterrae]